MAKGLGPWHGHWAYLFFSAYVMAQAMPLGGKSLGPSPMASGLAFRFWPVVRAQGPLVAYFIG